MCCYIIMHHIHREKNVRTKSPGSTLTTKNSDTLKNVIRMVHYRCYNNISIKFRIAVKFSSALLINLNKQIRMILYFSHQINLSKLQLIYFFR